MLGAAGVQLVPFSPLHDTQLPPGLSAVLLGGGAVADWADHLAANKPMLAALRAFAAAGGLVVGEGAALMYLSQSVQRPGRQRHSMGESIGKLAWSGSMINKLLVFDIQVCCAASKDRYW